MQAHRFQHLLETAPLANTALHGVMGSASACTAPVGVGLVACPAPLLAGISPERQQWMAELYRVALERAQEQVRPKHLDLPEAIAYRRARHIIWN